MTENSHEVLRQNIEEGKKRIFPGDSDVQNFPRPNMQLSVDLPTLVKRYPEIIGCEVLEISGMRHIPPLNDRSIFTLRLELDDPKVEVLMNQRKVGSDVKVNRGGLEVPEIYDGAESIGDLETVYLTSITEGVTVLERLVKESV